MTDQQPDQEFWDLTDSFIELANKQCEDADIGKVSEALLYAASRFSSFLVAASSESRKDFKEDKEEAFQYLSQQFRTMLSQNLDDYEENYKVYIREE